MPAIVQIWKEHLSKSNEKAAKSLANPEQYENLFPEYKDTINIEKFLNTQKNFSRKASEYSELIVSKHDLQYFLNSFIFYFSRVS